MTLDALIQALEIDQTALMEYTMHNEALASKVLKMYLRDPGVSRLSAAMEARDTQNARSAAHTIKGVSACLGFSRLHTLAKQMVEACDSGEEHRLAPLYGLILAEQHRILPLIEALEAASV